MEVANMARPEVTGRAIPHSPEAFSIPEFCAAHGISESFYYKLKTQGLGPDEMQLGARRIISKESAAVWRAQRTAETAA
jgi:predicted DNA-binding transcriptional regulator AlpA